MPLKGIIAFLIVVAAMTAVLIFRSTTPVPVEIVLETATGAPTIIEKIATSTLPSEPPLGQGEPVVKEPKIEEKKTVSPPTGGPTPITTPLPVPIPQLVEVIVPTSVPPPTGGPAPAPAPALAPVPKPLIDEDALKSAVVRVRCGSTFGSGFVKDISGKKYAFTAAHVVIDRVEAKNYNCDVILPRQDESGNYKEAHYRQGKILDPAGVEKNFKEFGYDIAVLEIVPLLYEDAENFPNGYPTINYPFCPSDTLGDSIYLFGYAANLGTAITPGAFLSKFTGNIIQYADVSGTNKKSSNEFASGLVYTPKMESSLDAGRQHPVVTIVSNNNFSGASGGLILDTDKQCIAGVNFATLVQNNSVYGFSSNPNFEAIRTWWTAAIGF